MPDLDLRIGTFWYDTTQALCDGTAEIPENRGVIFPMMHTVVVRRELLTRHPWLARAVYEGFLAVKEAGARRYRQGRRRYEAPFMVPWLNALYEENAELMTEDWWPYGVAANRAALDTLLRYHHEQGLTAHRWTIEEIFTHDLLET